MMLVTPRLLSADGYGGSVSGALAARISITRWQTSRHSLLIEYADHNVMLFCTTEKLATLKKVNQVYSLDFI